MKKHCQNCAHAHINRLNAPALSTIVCTISDESGWDRVFPWGFTCEKWKIKGGKTMPTPTGIHTKVTVIQLVKATLDNDIYMSRGCIAERTGKSKAAIKGAVELLEASGEIERAEVRMSNCVHRAEVVYRVVV